MSSDTGQATKFTTLAGARSKSSCAHPRDFRRSACTLKPATTPPATSFFAWSLLRFLSLVLLISILAICPASAQVPIPNSQPLPPGQDPNNKQGSSIKVDVNLVVLHTSVLDDRGRFADGLK